MGDVYRETRVYRERERDDSSSEDDRYKSTTVRRYKVPSSRAGRSSDHVVEVDEDRRSHFSGRNSGDRLDAGLGFGRERGGFAPDRPRSAFEPFNDRSRPAYYEREVEREIDTRREPDRSRVSVYESKETDRERDWDRRSHFGRHDDEVRVEKRVEEHFEDPHGHDVDRYRKETEYYTQPEPQPAPVIIRRRAPEPQQIIVQEAPSPAPIVVPRQDPGIVVLREREQENDREMVRRDPRDRDREEEYYYRHERRDGYRDDRDHHRDWAMARYDRHHHRDRERDRHSDDDEYYMRRTVVRRESSGSDHHHKRHLAEGALAGAGVSALLSTRRDKDGELPENRGRKVVAGAALGALGTEAFRRARSAYQDRYGDDDRETSPDHHSRLKKGLGIAAVALAAAGAAQYYKSNKIEKEESRRGRSRGRRHSGDSYSRSPSRSRARSRKRSMSTVAKAALGTAAAAGVVKHFRDKSKARSGKSRSRSKSRLRRVAEVGGAAAAAGVAAKMWKNHKEKKDGQRDLSESDDDRGYRGRGHSRSRGASHSRDRSMARSFHSDDGRSGELGLVEYGNDPLPSERGYESEAEERRRRRRRRDRSSSASGSDTGRKRSKSRLRDMAAAGAAAFGIKEYKDRKDQEKKDKRSRERRSKDRSDRSRDRDRDRRDRRDDDDGYFDDRPHRPQHSPPTASGGAYFPPYPSTPGGPPGGPPGGGAYTQYPNPPPGDFQQYAPQDYMGYPPPPPGPPPGPGGYPPPPPGPPPGGPLPPDHVSDNIRSNPSRSRHVDVREDGVRRESDSSSERTPPPPVSKSVSFIPLSPGSSRTMEMHRKQQAAASDAEPSWREDEEQGDDDRVVLRDGPHRRRSSDTSSDRPIVRRRRDRRDSDSDSDIEELPRRFDSQGHQLDGDRSRMTTRRGAFERPPQHQGDWDVRGAWQVSGTEGEMVDRLVRNVTGVLEGRQNWIGAIGDVLGGQEGRKIEDGDDDEGHGKRRKRR